MLFVCFIAGGSTTLTKGICIFKRIKKKTQYTHINQPHLQKASAYSKELKNKLNTHILINHTYKRHLHIEKN